MTKRGVKLEEAYPNVVKLWDYKINKDTPNDISQYSRQYRYFKCEKNHNYKTRIDSITNSFKKNQNGCRKCLKYKLVTKEKSFGYLHKDLLKYWDYEKNIDTPYELASKSEHYVWWKCEIGHSYKQKVYQKTKGDKCPFCRGLKVGQGNDLQTKYPKIAKQWSSKNNIKPNEVVPGCNKKFIWKCEKKHEWVTTVNARVNNNSGCPKCVSQLFTSKPEIKLRKLLNGKIKKIAGYPVDIVVKDWVIQYDGARYHTNCYKRDLRRTNAIINEGYKIIRIRVQDKQHPLKDIPNAINIHFNKKDESKLYMIDLVKKIKKVMV